MNPAQRRTSVVAFLGLLAVAQLSLIEKINNRREPGGGFIAEGASLAGVEVVDARGPRTLLPSGTGRFQVLLVFSSDCPHCETVAPAWKDWTANHPSQVDLLAVTGDSLKTGQAFGGSRGWNVEVAATLPSDRPGAVADLLKRTPWLFLLDENGTVLFEGHGGQLAALDSAISVHLESGAPEPGSR